VVLCVYLLPKSTIPNARARNPNRFFSALAVEALLPASGNRSNYSHDFFVDTPRRSRYIAYLRYATIFALADASAASMWRLSEGDRCSGRWYEAAIEQQTRRKWSFAIRDRGPWSLSGALTERIMGKKLWSAGVDGLALNRGGGCHAVLIGIQDLRFRARTLSRPTWHSVKARRSQRAQCPNHGHRVSGVTVCKSSWVVEITSR
jgi:hypothetical protein